MYQLTPEQPRQGFAKRSRNIFLTDNKSDEMMANVLELFPNKKQYIFQGKEGEMRKKALQNKVREKFNMASEEDGYAEFGKKFGKKIKKGLKSISINNAKKGLKQVSIKNIGAGLKKVGRAVKTAALAPARGAFLGLVRLNFRGSASRFNLLNEQGQKKLYEKWDKLGGKTDALQRAIDAGKGKKVLACGKKCRAKAGKNPQLPTEAQSDYVNFEPTTNAALISAGGGVLATMVKVVGDKSNYKSQIELAQIEAEQQKAEENERKIDATMTPQEAALADEIIKAQDSSFDAVKAIVENPNLTAEEKTAALEDLKDDVVGMSITTKILIGVGILAAIGLGFYLFKQSNKN
jgi:hypothetical protein